MSAEEKMGFWGRFDSLTGDLSKLVDTLIGEEREIIIPADDLLTMDVYASEPRPGFYDKPLVLEGYGENPEILTESN